MLGIPTVQAGKPVKKLDLYLCIGQSNMAGRGKLSPEVMDTIQYVYLLNAEDKFEPAVNPLNRFSTIGRGPTGEFLGPVSVSYTHLILIDYVMLVIMRPWRLILLLLVRLVKGYHF